jgi:hypothetical protein
VNNFGVAAILLVAVISAGLLVGNGDPFGGNNWEDLRFPSNNIRLSGAAPASDQAYRGGVVLSFSSVTDNYVYLTVQMPHSWREGDNVTAHIHWTIPVGGLGGVAENVKWDLTYSWANMNASFPVQSTASFTRNVATVTANTHLLNDWVELNGAGKTRSSMIILSVKRDTSVANDYASTALLLEFDIHYRQNRFGSPTVP